MAGNSENSNRRKQPQRIILNTSDVMRLTGKHYNTALRMMQLVREAYGKSRSGLVTITEFATVWEIDEETIRNFMD